MQHRDITVTGKVQGVFFRAATRARAHALGVKGRVSNKPDGSVYVEAEGSAELLDEFQPWLHLGPPAARVEQVIAVAGDVKGYHDFTIG